MQGILIIFFARAVIRIFVNLEMMENPSTLNNNALERVIRSEGQTKGFRLLFDLDNAMGFAVMRWVMA